MIYYSFYRNLEMLEMCTAAIDGGQAQMLTEILLKFSFATEMHHFLPANAFAEMLYQVKYRKITKNEAYPLEFNKIYLFFHAGVICKRDREQKIQKNIKNKDKVKLEGRLNKRMDFNYPIDQYDAFEDHCGSRPVTLSYTSFKKNALLLEIDLASLSLSTNKAISELKNDKIKLLLSFCIFAGVERSLLSEIIFKFKFTCLKFNQYLYNERKRTQQTFFVMEGSVETSSLRNCFQTYVTDGKCVSGYVKERGEVVRAVSEMVVCYFIETQRIEQFLLKKHHNLQNEQKKYINAATTPIIQVREYTPSLHYSVSDVKIQKKDLPTFSFKRSHYRNATIKQQERIKKEKYIKVKKHFSNYYNEIFEEFSEHKIREMGLKSKNNDSAILFNMPGPVRKTPLMEELSEKLKKLRIQKFNKCKLILQSNYTTIMRKTDTFYIEDK